EVITSPLGPALRLATGVTADLGDLGDIDSDQPFSCGAWVQVNDTVDGALLARMDVGNRYRGWDLWMKGSRAGVQLISSWNQDALRVLAGPAVSSQGWHHVFVTYDGSRKAKSGAMYYDGEREAVYVEAALLGGWIRTKTPLRVNGRSTGEGAGGAALTDIRFYREALSAREVQVLAKRGAFETVLAAGPGERTKEA